MKLVLLKSFKGHASQLCLVTKQRCVVGQLVRNFSVITSLQQIPWVGFEPYVPNTDGLLYPG